MTDAQRHASSPWFRAIAIVGVSAYLVTVYGWLVMSRRIRGAGFVRHALSRFKPRYRGRLGEVRAEIGHCYTATLPGRLSSDREGTSRLCVLENGVALAHPHALHDEIRTLGGGRFSHWGEALYFSTSDNTDPSTNGREYRVEER